MRGEEREGRGVRREEGIDNKKGEVEGKKEEENEEGKEKVGREEREREIIRDKKILKKKYKKRKEKMIIMRSKTEINKKVEYFCSDIEGSGRKRPDN